MLKKGENKIFPNMSEYLRGNKIYNKSRGLAFARGRESL